MKLNNVDFNKIAVFSQIVDSGNYQRASEALGVTPSALSQTVSHLEHHLGFALFDRVGRRLVPTAQGLRLQREFKQYQNGFLNSLREISGRQDEVKGVLKVGAYLEFAKSKLTGLLKDFIQNYPETQIKMTFDTPTRLQALLEEGQLDFCFSIYPARGKKTLSSHPLVEEELVLIAPKKFLSDNPTLDEVMQTPMIEYYSNHQPLRRWLSLHYQKRTKKIPARILASTAEMVLSLVREGAGIGIVPYYLVSSAEAQKGLKVVRPTPRKLTDYIWLLEKSDTRKAGVHRAFRRELEKKFPEVKALK